VKLDISTKGFDDLIASLARTNDNVDRASVLAVNRGARDGRALGARQIREEVNYSRGYLSGAEGRLAIAQRATTSNPEAIIRGRDRPTSLARFATSPVRFGRQHGVRVRVATQGSATTLRSGFFIRLRNSNVGLAVRLKKGESLIGSQAAKQLENGVWLLYGPSVDQVFQGVAADIVDEVGDIAASEFIRQFERLEANGR
jgi:hypothetical protein